MLSVYLHKETAVKTEDQRLIEAVITQDETGKTNEEIAEELGISLSTFYRKKRSAPVKVAIVNAAKDKAWLLLPTAVEETKKMLEDPDTPATAKTRLIQMVFTSTGLTKVEGSSMAASEYYAPEKPKMDLDGIMKHYGIQQNRIKTD